MYLRPQREEEQEHAKEIEAGLQSETMKKKTEETNKKKEGGAVKERGIRRRWRMNKQARPRLDEDTMRN